MRDFSREIRAIVWSLYTLRAWEPHNIRMDVDFAAPYLPMIAAFCSVALGAVLLLKRILALVFSRKETIMTLIVGNVATLLSLFYHTKDRWAGARVTHTSGWPHFFYDKQNGLELGPLCSYVLLNILFYSSLFLLGLTVKKGLLRR